MRLTNFTDYGLRILILAARSQDRLVTIDEASQTFSLSRHHVAKIVRRLAGAKIVTTRRGQSGGFSLARPPEQITVGDIVRLLEADQALVECFRADGGTCVLTPECRLKGVLARGREAFHQELDKTTLAECAAPIRAACDAAAERASSPCMMSEFESDSVPRA